MDIATDLAVVLDSYLNDAKAGLTLKPARIVRVPGQEVVWDDCCDGQLHIRVISMDPLVRRPHSAAGIACDVIGFTVALGLGVVRCAATLNDQGQAPSPKQINDDNQQMLLDMSELQSVMLCSPHTYDVLRWQPLGVTGGCHGGEWTFTVRVNANACGVGDG